MRPVRATRRGALLVQAARTLWAMAFEARVNRFGIPNCVGDRRVAVVRQAMKCTSRAARQVTPESPGSRQGVAANRKCAKRPRRGVGAAGLPGTPWIFTHSESPRLIDDDNLWWQSSSAAD
jgi:hypothetical protein